MIKLWWFHRIFTGLQNIIGFRMFKTFTLVTLYLTKSIPIEVEKFVWRSGNGLGGICIFARLLGLHNLSSLCHFHFHVFQVKRNFINSKTSSPKGSLPKKKLRILRQCLNDGGRGLAKTQFEEKKINWDKGRKGRGGWAKFEMSYLPSFEIS